MCEAKVMQKRRYPNQQKAWEAQPNLIESKARGSDEELAASAVPNESNLCGLFVKYWAIAIC